MPLLDSKEPAEISAIEDRIFLDHKHIIEQYADKFEAYGCHIMIQKIWKYDGDETIYYERPQLSRGYGFWINCDMVNKNGAVVESDDHDIHMSMSWGILGYDTKYFRKEKTFVQYNEVEIHIDEVREQMEDFLNDMEFCGLRRLR